MHWDSFVNSSHRHLSKYIHHEFSPVHFKNRIITYLLLSQVMEPYYPFKNGTVEDFIIGKENCENKSGYCNGPLKSGSTYRVKVRAFTAPDKFTDTSYSFPIQTGECRCFGCLLLI